MKTEDLIRAMAADTRRPPRIGEILPLALAVTTAIAAAGFLSLLGIRPDFAQAVQYTDTQIKHVFPIVLAAGAFVLSTRLARPGAQPGAALVVLALAPVLILGALGVEMRTQPAARWADHAFVPSMWTCIVSIPVISAPILAGSLWALRGGASVRPALSGAVAGLLSGGTGAAVYAFYCNQDSPFYFVLWYPLAIAFVALVGAGLGARYLRW